ncbi:MAG: hypothetical protein HC794_07365, partial [Nitrospiraceae bacterium]|nr:hypothetical protein [Nitrospiraceae bacterium]
KYLPVEPWDKRALLLKLLKTEKPETTVVFCKTKATVRKVAEYLKTKDINVREIHGDLQQAKRTKVMNAFRDEQVDVLIASDLAARGLDVDHITHVINYDLPEDPEVYIHRDRPHRRAAGAARPGPLSPRNKVSCSQKSKNSLALRSTSSTSPRSRPARSPLMSRRCAAKASRDAKRHAMLRIAQWQPALTRPPATPRLNSKPCSPTAKSLKTCHPKPWAASSNAGAGEDLSPRRRILKPTVLMRPMGFNPPCVWFLIG